MDRGEEASFRASEKCIDDTFSVKHFNEEFILEYDASNTSIGVVLLQKSHPIAYISKGPMSGALDLSTYDKEILSILLATQK